jgi:hypothetical protein
MFYRHVGVYQQENTVLKSSRPQTGYLNSVSVREANILSATEGCRKMLVGQPEGSKSSGRTRRKWDNIKTDFQDIG